MLGRRRLLRLLPITLTLTLTPKTLIHNAPISDPSLTLYFLQKSCNLTPAAAATAASKLHLSSTKKPHAVLSLLKSHAFTPTQIAQLISLRPRLLIADPLTNLKPKLDFFTSLSLPNLTTILTNCPNIFLASLEHRLLPNFTALRTIIPNRDLIAAALNRSPQLLLCDQKKLLLPKIQAMREYRVPDRVIVKLLTSQGSCLVGTPTYFDYAFTVVKKIGMSPKSTMFGHALAVLIRMRENGWERKMENFRGIGWTEEEVLKAFVKHPYCMSISEEKVRRNMKFFEREFGWKPEYVSKNPTLLSYSLEKRIVPRSLVLRILAAKGLYKENVGRAQFSLGENVFMKKFVTEYQNQVPYVVDAMTGKIGLEDLDKECKKFDWRRYLGTIKTAASQ